MRRARYGMLALLLFVAVSAILPVPVSAVTVGVCGPSLENLGECTKSLTISGNTVTIVLTNTSPADNGGFITADAFNLGDASIVAGSFTTTDADFILTVDPGNISANPFDDRDALIALSDDWEGGGNPNPGIGVGGSATFTFQFTGTLDEGFIFNSEVIRFRGFDDDGSDKSEVTETPGVPEPTTLVLLGSGIVGLGAWMRRRRA